MRERWRLLFITTEQGALRLGEAVGLRWADVDAAGLRLRLPRSATKRDRVRWGLPPRLARSGNRGELFAGGSHPRAQGVPGDHGSARPSGDDAGVPQRPDTALPSARPAPPTDHDLAPVGCSRPRACRARRARAALYEPRRVLARHAPGRGSSRAVLGTYRRLERRRGVVSVWSQRHAGVANPA